MKDAKSPGKEPPLILDVEKFDGLPVALSADNFLRANRSLPLKPFYRAVICYVADYGANEVKR